MKDVKDVPKIAFAGPKGGGKTWLLEQVAKRIDRDTQSLKLVKDVPSVVAMAFADPIYDVQSLMFNSASTEFIPGRMFNELLKAKGLDDKVNDDIGMSPRQFRQKFGTEFIRNMGDPDAFVNLLKLKLRVMDEQSPSGIIILDLRFPNELELCVKENFFICYVNTMQVTEGEDKHESESYHHAVSASANMTVLGKDSADNAVNVISAMLYSHLEENYTTSGLIVPKGKMQ